ncbi:DUF4198 domain-containing protein [Hymenobacter sp. H14-R3]|uniref:DUF4198 domain-containing protein n=1 Tax=Hymenobacter sp. H14-R3 TaxID=3046308 RepID=UPI0024BB5FF6|nr:DUF4198 domain-containing protein [Hymenobacter sp. H14-R3]MDJ0364133.1 DUF4198 domain-containing protein [Hymenobacter sp. H14-R3]
MKKVLAAAALVLAATALPLLAHDAWVDPLGGPIYQVFYGHKVPENYPAAKVTTLQVLDAEQHFLPYTRLPTAKGLSIKPTGQPAMFVLDFDNGYWTKTLQDKESRNVRLTAQPAAAGGVGSRLFKYSKTVLRWQPWMFKAVGQRFEFVPEAFSGALRAGQPFQVRLLLDGQPLANAMVENNSNEEGPHTDANGLVTIKLVKGINRLANDLDIAQTADPDATRLSLTAALVFVAE